MFPRTLSAYYSTTQTTKYTRICAYSEANTKIYVSIICTINFLLQLTCLILLSRQYHTLSKTNNECIFLKASCNTHYILFVYSTRIHFDTKKLGRLKENPTFHTVSQYDILFLWLDSPLRAYDNTFRIRTWSAYRFFFSHRLSLHDKTHTSIHAHTGIRT